MTGFAEAPQMPFGTELVETFLGQIEYGDYV